MDEGRPNVLVACEKNGDQCVCVCVLCLQPAEGTFYER